MYNANILAWKADCRENLAVKWDVIEIVKWCLVSCGLLKLHTWDSFSSREQRDF